MKIPPITYTIVYNKNADDAAGTMENSAHTYDVAKALNANGFTRTGYTFACWAETDTGAAVYTDGQSVMNLTETIGATITLYAQWVPAAVTFDKNGGDTEADPLAITLTPPATTVGTLPAPPARASYIFNGWNTQADGTGTSFTATTTVTGNITVYAQWKIEIEGMAWVPGGSFEMGKNLGTGGGSDATPVHTVTLSGFYIGKYEVTQAQYEAVTGSLPSSLTSNSYSVGGNYPVYYVSWYDALVFCNKLSIMEGLTPAYRISNSTNPNDWGTVPTSSNSTWNAAAIDSGSTGYRLPTEAQWEYAAKGGDPLAAGWAGYTYAGSDAAGDVAWYEGNSNGTSHVVGTKAPNGLGLYDMSGNVFEWCWDWYGSYTSGAKENPTGASSGSNRVRRGGSYINSADSVSSAYRGDNDRSPDSRYANLGFRLARPAQ